MFFEFGLIEPPDIVQTLMFYDHALPSDNDMAASILFLLLRWGSWPTTQSFDHAKLLGGTGGSKLETYF